MKAYDEGIMKYYRTDLGFQLPKSDQKIRVRNPKRLPIIPQKANSINQNEKRLSDS